MDKSLLDELLFEFAEANWTAFQSFCDEKGVDPDELDREFDERQKELY